MRSPSEKNSLDDQDGIYPYRDWYLDAYWDLDEPRYRER